MSELCYGVDAESGNDFIVIGKTDDSIRFLFNKRLDQVRVVANCSYGYVSTRLDSPVVLTVAPWKSQILFKTDSGTSVTIDLEIASEVSEWLNQHDIETIDDSSNL